MYIVMKYVHSYEICTFLLNMCIVMKYAHSYEIYTFLPNMRISTTVSSRSHSSLTSKKSVVQLKSVYETINLLVSYLFK